MSNNMKKDLIEKIFQESIEVKKKCMFNNFDSIVRIGDEITKSVKKVTRLCFVVMEGQLQMRSIWLQKC